MMCILIIFVLILQPTLNSLSDAECLPTWLDCGNGICLAPIWRCDGDNDCGNMKDEEDCENFPEKKLTCFSSQFPCADNQHCIPNTWYCDGEKDCLDGSDEQKCENASGCAGFRCNDHHCIPERWHCDGQMDCSDGEDERNCSSKNNGCSSSEFTCSSGLCISKQLLCNGRSDCPADEDEGINCTVCKNSTCAHQCRATPSGEICHCNAGYQLDSDGKSCSDINECLKEGFCSQRCSNSLGGFTCSCIDGYELKNRTCLAKGADPLLIFATKGEIRGFRLRDHRYFPIHETKFQLASVDFDPKDSRVFWTETSAVNSAIYSANLDGSDVKLILTNGLLNPEDVAVDWLGRNIYVTDSRLKQLLVCRLDGTVCHAVHDTDVDKPTGIALDPPKGILYWADRGKSPGIYSSGMDGSRKRDIVNRDIKWPTSITIDHTTDRLYWCDGQLYRIEYITLDGKTRKILLSENVFHPYAIAVFEDRIYWSDWITFSLDSCNKFTGHEQHTMVRENGKHIIGIHVYHTVLHKHASNPCWSSLCSHLCVIGSSGRHRCVCPPGFSLESDEATCLMEKTSPQIFVKEEETVFHIQPDAVGENIATTLPISHLVSIGDLAYDFVGRILYISDVRRHVIVAVNVTTFTKREVAKLHVETPEGLDYDWLGNNLYWSDSSKGTVEALATNAGYRTVLLEKLSTPRDLVLCPEKGLMFLAITGGRRPHVAMYDMDGKNHRRLDGTTGLPMSLALDRSQNRIYWSDPRQGVIASVNFINPIRSKKIHQEHLDHVLSIAISEKFIYWTEAKDHKVSLSSRNDTRPKVHSILLPGNHNGSVISKVKYMKLVKHDLNSCAYNKNKCSHICFVTPPGRTCACPIGLHLDSDKVTCKVPQPEECSSTEFRCTSSSECVPVSWKCDGVEDCKDGTDEEKCELPGCPKGDFQCRNGRCITMAWKCDFTDDCKDGSDEEGCPTAKRCESDEFDCGGGHCIPHLWRCDGESDCGDGNRRDEEDCHSNTCGANQIHCANGQCIPISWGCDGEKDCADNSDERDCAKAKPACKSDEFLCDNNVCVDKEMVCDHFDDCQDNSDERNCIYNRTCSAGMTQCPDGMCIYDHEVCDGHNDCKNGEEEANCTIAVCEEREFYCSSTKRCIPILWLCDGDDDCGDWSDETVTSCMKPHTTTSSTAKGCDQFSCNSGECLTWTKVCNNVPDCQDFSDEGSHCDSSCSRGNGGCSQMCRSSPQGSVCSCSTGYVLMDDGKTCEDEDECQRVGVCSHFCNNTKGGFKCSCADGYFLMLEHRKCRADGGSGTLLFLLPDQIRGIDLGSHSHRIYVHGAMTDMRGMDYDATDGVFFWSEWKEGTISSFSPGSSRHDIIAHDLHRPYYLKWDWVAKNLYYTVADGLIKACSRNGQFCSLVLDTNTPHINSLELAPENGLMFWSVWSVVLKKTSGVIERADMDGSKRITLVSDKIHWATSLTVDHVLKMIYWTDVKLNHIETSDFHGLNRRVILQEGMLYPFSMALFEDHVYWADWGTDSIIRCNKFTGGEQLQVHKGDTKAEVIAIVHRVQQPKGVNYCENRKCPQMCLLKSTGYACRCDENFKSSSNSTSCTQITTTSPKTPMTDNGEEICLDDYCMNGADCVIVAGQIICRCPYPFGGERCETTITAASVSSDAKDYSWIVGVIIGLLVISLILLMAVVCRRNGGKLGNIGSNVAVTFRNPMCRLKKSGRLVMDTDDAVCDELMLGKKGAYKGSGFGNPVFGQQPYLLCSSEDGEFKRWPSYDSEDSAFVSECQTREGSLHNLEEETIPSAPKTGERLIQFFKRI